MPRLADASAVKRSSVGEFAEHRIHAAVPRAIEQFELALGRRLVRFDNLQQRLQEDALVGAVAVEAGAALEAVRGDLQRFGGQLAYRVAAERQLQRMLGH